MHLYVFMCAHTSTLFTYMVHGLDSSRSQEAQNPMGLPVLRSPVINSRPLILVTYEQSLMMVNHL